MFRSIGRVLVAVALSCVGVGEAVVAIHLSYEGRIGEAIIFGILSVAYFATLILFIVHAKEVDE